MKSTQKYTILLTLFGEHVDQRDLVHTAGGNINWYIHIGKQSGFILQSCTLTMS